MNPVFSTALALQRFCASRGWDFCFIGGIAIQVWAEPRVTRDVDLTVLTGFGDRQEPIIAELMKEYPPRRADAADFALRNRVLLLQNSDGVGIDISMGALPFETNAVERAELHSLAPGIDLRIVGATFSTWKRSPPVISARSIGHMSRRTFARSPS